MIEQNNGTNQFGKGKGGAERRSPSSFLNLQNCSRSSGAVAIATGERLHSGFVHWERVILSPQ